MTISQYFGKNVLVMFYNVFKLSFQ